MKKDGNYSSLAKEIINTCMGDKIVLPENKTEKDPKNESIEMKFDSSRQKQIPLSIQQRIYNIISNIIFVIFIMLISIAAINCIVYIIGCAMRVFFNDILTDKVLYAIIIRPVIKYFIINLKFIIKSGLPLLGLSLINYLIRLLIDFMERRYLKKKIEKSYDAIGKKMEALDKEEERRLNAAAKK